MRVITDYTKQQDTFEPGIFSSYRLAKFIRGVVCNWAADQNNIQDKRLLGLFFGKDGKPNVDLCNIGTAFNKQSRYAGATPAITVSIGQAQYAPRDIALTGNAYIGMTQNNISTSTRMKTIGVDVSVITQGYDSTMLLADMLQSYLLRNTIPIVEDCPMLAALDVTGIDATSVVETQTQAKQVYGTVVHLVATGYVCWTIDTQGPVFRGITLEHNNIQ